MIKSTLNTHEEINQVCDKLISDRYRSIRVLKMIRDGHRKAQVIAARTGAPLNLVSHYLNKALTIKPKE